MKKEEELLRDLKEMIKETRNGAMKWKILCQSTEYNDADQKPVVEEDGVKWQVDECYVLYQTTYKGKEFLMISYEMIHSTAQNERTTNLIFLPPAGIRFFDVSVLLPYAVECDQMLAYEVHTLWQTLLEEHKKHPELIELDAEPRELTIEDDK